MKWQKKTDAIELNQQIEFRGTTWLTDTMDISLAALFAGLDASVLTEVPAQQAFDSVITVDSDPMLANASVSMSYSVGTFSRGAGVHQGRRHAALHGRQHQPAAPSRSRATRRSTIRPVFGRSSRSGR